MRKREREKAILSAKLLPYLYIHFAYRLKKSKGLKLLEHCMMFTFVNCFVSIRNSFDYCIRRENMNSICASKAEKPPPGTYICTLHSCCVV